MHVLQTMFLVIKEGIEHVSHPNIFEQSGVQTPQETVKLVEQALQIPYIQLTQFAGHGKQYLPIGPYANWQFPQVPASIPSAMIVPAKTLLLNLVIAAVEVTKRSFLQVRQL